MTHTPGPWTIVNDGTDVTPTWNIRAGEEFIANLTKNALIDSKGRNNARLATTAPELLEALEEVTKWLGNVRDYTYDGVLIDMNEAAHRRIMVDARATIAKAKGQ